MTEGRETTAGVLDAAEQKRAMRSLEGVSLSLLTTFACVARELHFTRASQQMHLSQPGLTRRIAVLERCLGQTLLRRSTRQVELTDSGAALLPHVVIILEHFALGSAAVRAAALTRRAAGH